MKKVTRGPKPDSLRRGAEKWTKELLKAITESKQEHTKVPDKFYDKYKKLDVLACLKQMYGDDIFSYCCYCESTIDVVSFEQVEHRKPKKKSLDKYPEHTYYWNNLHLVCEKCNNAKSNKYDEVAPILDAAVDPIKEHLDYELSDIQGVYRKTLSDRGITTVKHADLDRSSLRNTRLKIWNVTTKLIYDIKKLGDNPRAYTAKKMIWDKCSGEHGSLILHLLDMEEIEDVR